MQLTVKNKPFLQKAGYFFRYNKKKILIGSIVFAVLISILAFFSTRCDLYYWVDGMIYDMCSNDALDTIVSQAQVNISPDSINIGGTDMGDLSGTMHTLNGVCVSVAISIFCILWLISLATNFIQQQAYAELVVKRLLVLGIGVVLIAKAMTISTEVCNLGAAIAGEIGSGVSAESGDAAGIVAALHDQVEESARLSVEGEEEEEEEIELVDPEDDSGDEVKNQWGLAKWLSGVWDKITAKIKEAKIALHRTTELLSIGLSLLFPWLMLKISHALVSVFTITRAVEILVLCVMSPIPFAFVANEPFGNGPGMRFIKNLGALSVQGAVMIIIAIICQRLTNGYISSLDAENISSEAWKLIAIAFAELGLLMKSLSISQKVFGLQ